MPCQDFSQVRLETKQKPACTQLSAKMCCMNVLSNLEFHLPLLLATIKKTLILTTFPCHDICSFSKLLFQTLHISWISTGCHCCSMQTEHQSASSLGHFGNGPVPQGRAHCVLSQNLTILPNQPGTVLLFSDSKSNLS